MYSPLKNREGIKETRPSKLWQRLLRLLLETGKKLANEGASPVTIPESIAKHISAPVRLWSLKWRVLRDNLPSIGHH